MPRLTDEQRERLDPPRVDEITRGEQALARAEALLASQAARPLAERYYLQELAEREDGEPDGRFISQVLERLADELRVLSVRGPMPRELALCLTHIENAELWAIAHGRKANSHVIIDRRIFRTTKEPDPC